MIQSDKYLLYYRQTRSYDSLALLNVLQYIKQDLSPDRIAHLTASYTSQKEL